MTQIVILNPETLKVSDWYFSDSPYVPVTPGIRLEVPDGLTWDVVKAVQEGDEVTLTEDPTKVQARLDAQWASVRAQQKELLYKSDWTCSVTDYEVPNKDEWVQYRAQLRDVTKQSDPFAIVWPVVPGQEVAEPVVEVVEPVVEVAEVVEVVEVVEEPVVEVAEPVAEVVEPVVEVVEPVVEVVEPVEEVPAVVEVTEPQ